MKKIYFIFTLISIQFVTKAQEISHQEAYDLIKLNKKSIGLNDTEIQQTRISAAYFNVQAGTKMVYLQQQYTQLDVWNEMMVLAFKNNQLVSNAGNYIRNISVISNNPMPTIGAAQAVQKVLTDRNVQTQESISPISISNNGTRVQFSDLGVSNEKIDAELIWLPMYGKYVKLCWQIKYVPKMSNDYWMIRIDAHTNIELDKNNLTVYCNWSKKEGEANCYYDAKPHFHKPNTSQTTNNNVRTINNATYRVIPYPFESPQHMPSPFYGDVVDPWLAAGVSDATTLRWHSTAPTTDFNFTRGNNVWAQEDRDNNNTTFGRADTSSTPAPYTFNRTPDYTVAPTTPTNEKFNITNLFYWNNIIHNISYLYGFNEVSGNFQENNLSRGGAGADYVIADAQDAGGTNNANFSTPTDGSRPRMQMYLWTGVTPNRDGDVDNGIIVHEYAHGVSNRFTGGPGNSSCLGNQEQMGEGWSDYLGLMYTTNWATTTLADSANARGIGTYALNQPVTGTGIRQYPYTSNMTINPFTYSNITTVSVPHGVGSVWCTILWDMTWNMIKMDGINPNLYNPTATGGNSAALRLVFEGMRLQPCSPGFVDGRNAILRADTLLYGGRYSCAIWNAFARRGVGVNASQGSSGSRSDQTVNFETKVYNAAFTQSVNQQNENNTITYNTNIAATCGTITNFYLTDTLPTNVTYVSGGTYNATDRTVRFNNITLNSGQNQNYQFTVRLNTGSYFPPNLYINDSVNVATISPVWTASSITNTNAWTTSTAQLNTGAFSLFVANPASNSEQRLTTTSPINLPANSNAIMSFSHFYNTESLWDGGVVEISTNSGTTWTDLGNFMTQGAYNSTLNSSAFALGSRRAFSGNSGGFVVTQIDLSSFAGQNVLIRFRFASDVSQAAIGWFIDDITIVNEAFVIIKNNIFNASNVRLNSETLRARILPSVLSFQLMQFAGVKNNNEVNLIWSLLNENNIKYYEVEKSMNGINFNKIGTKNANNSSTTIQYSLTDNLISNDQKYYYYRLKIFNSNGTFSYSKIIKVNIDSKTNFSIIPNPVETYLSVFGFADAKVYNASIIDMYGKVVFNKTISALNNEIETSHLASGVYYLRLSNNQQTESIRFIKK